MVVLLELGIGVTLVGFELGIDGELLVGMVLESVELMMVVVRSGFGIPVML